MKIRHLICKSIAYNCTLNRQVTNVSRVFNELRAGGAGSIRRRLIRQAPQSPRAPIRGGPACQSADSHRSRCKSLKMLSLGILGWAGAPKAARQRGGHDLKFQRLESPAPSVPSTPAPGLPNKAASPAFKIATPSPFPARCSPITAAGRPEHPTLSHSITNKLHHTQTPISCMSWRHQLSHSLHTTPPLTDLPLT